jgi:hypothetical protein
LDEDDGGERTRGGVSNGAGGIGQEKEKDSGRNLHKRRTGLKQFLGTSSLGSRTRVEKVSEIQTYNRPS